VFFFPLQIKGQGSLGLLTQLSALYLDKAHLSIIYQKQNHNHHQRKAIAALIQIIKTHLTKGNEMIH
jgi:hypothetical protein